MIEVFDEKLVDECLSEVADSDIKTYAYCLLDWAVQKRKVKAIPLDEIKQARKEMTSYIEPTASQWTSGYNNGVNTCVEILDKLIESEGE